jgi:hypothetical protein
MSPAGFEPAIPTSERPQTHALDRAVTEIKGVNVRWVGQLSDWRYELFCSPLPTVHHHIHKIITHGPVLNQLNPFVYHYIPLLIYCIHHFLLSIPVIVFLSAIRLSHVDNGGVATAPSPLPTTAVSSVTKQRKKPAWKCEHRTNYVKNLATWTDVSHTFPGLIGPITWYLLRCK